MGCVCDRQTEKGVGEKERKEKRRERGGKREGETKEKGERKKRREIERKREKEVERERERKERERKRERERERERKRERETEREKERERRLGTINKVNYGQLDQEMNSVSLMHSLTSFSLRSYNTLRNNLRRDLKTHHLNPCVIQRLKDELTH